MSRLSALVAAAFAASLLVLPGVAQPQVPAVFFGTASIDGAPVPDGTEVRAFIDGLDCTAISPEPLTITEAGVSVYVVHVVHESQRPGCGVEGDIVSFTIGGAPASPDAPWATTLAGHNLNTGTGAPLPLPTELFTPAAQPSSAATRPPDVPPDALPTDDPNVIPGTDVQPPATTESDGGSDLTVPLLVGLGVILALGGAGGVLLLRRHSADG